MTNEDTPKKQNLHVVPEMGVILTKDNLARRIWNGSKVCCFFNKLETIQHLFFDCHYARFLWRAVHLVFGITHPTSVSHLFGGWSKLGRPKQFARFDRSIGPMLGNLAHKK